MQMRDEIRRESWKRMAIIEEAYGSLTRLPSYVMTAHRLYALLYEASLEKYFASFGWLPIDSSEVGDAKSEFNWGDLTAFELEVIALVNEACRRMEEKNRRPAQISLSR